MNTEQLNSLVAVIFALIGASLLWFGIKRKKRFMYTLGTGFLVGAGVAVFVESAQLREILTAAASVFAVFISALSIDEARRIRKDSLDRENRDRKERLLNEIIEWAIDVAKCSLEKDLPDTSRITDMNDAKLHLAHNTQILARSFQSMRGRNQYISKIVSTFGQDLQEATNSLIKDVEEHIKLLDILYGVVIAEFTSQIINPTTQIAMHRRKLDDSANKVIEEATKIKTQNIG
jgi:hypothetical protein